MLISFVLASIVITLMPGPSMILVIMQALQRNLANAALAALGVVVADAILLGITFSGLGPLLYSSATAFSLVKWAGVAYLIYLGIKQFGSRASLSLANENAKGTAFQSALLTTLLNPKIIGFFIAFFPQFIEPTQPLTTQLALLAPLFLLIVFLVLMLYALLADKARTLLTQRISNKGLNRSCGLSLIGSGVLASGLNVG